MRDRKLGKRKDSLCKRGHRTGNRSIANSESVHFKQVEPSVLGFILTVLQQEMSLFLLLGHQLHRNRQHSVYTLQQAFFVTLQKKICPVTHERTCIANNRSRVCNRFAFKADGVTSFPNSPANRCNAQRMKFCTSRKPKLTPIPTLIK